MSQARTQIPGADQTDVETLIVGTGFSGQCMAIKLKEAGNHNFIIVDRASDVGGTWRDNSYPGCACDVPSHLYSFSFAQNPNWSRKFPRQQELYDYLKDIAQRYDLMPHIRFNHTIKEARYSDDSKRWTVTTSQGTFIANRVVFATGGLSQPKLPDFKGIDDFKGPSFHCARWDHSVDLKGKRVAVVGTGASAIQFVPELAKYVGEMDVYQRTPQWIVPRGDRAISKPEQWLLKHVKPYQWLFRQWIYWTHETRVLGIVIHPAFMKMFQKKAEGHLKKQVTDLELRAKLTPNYTIGCKRILISNDWYPALQQDNVDLVTSGIDHISENGIVDGNGVERQYDAIVYNTGFHTARNPMAEVIYGSGGQRLRDAWEDGEEAYLGSSVSGFPNMHLIIGPNITLGHSSMVLMIEAQVKHIMNCIKMMWKNDSQTIDVKPEVQAGYNRKLQDGIQGSVWSTGCSSWYQNENGKITVLWPGFTFTFDKRSDRDPNNDYSLS